MLVFCTNLGPFIVSYSPAIPVLSKEHETATFTLETDSEVSRIVSI